MKIRAKLLMITLFPVAILLLSIAAFFSFGHYESNYLKKALLADNMEKSMSGLAVLTYEYKRLLGARPQKQFCEVYNQLGNLLEQAEPYFTLPEEDELFDEIKRSYRIIGVFYQELSASGDRSVRHKPAIHREYLDKVYRKLLIEIQASIRRADMLYRINREKTLRLSGMRAKVNIGCVFGLVLSLAAVALSLMRSIAVPIVRLRTGMKNFSPVIQYDPLPVTSGDELGELTRSFNEMALKLKRQGEIDSALIEISQKILDERDVSVEEVSSVVLAWSQRITGSKFGFAGSVDAEVKGLVALAMSRNVWEECRVHDKSTALKKFGGVWKWVLNNKSAVISNDFSKDPRAAGEPEGHARIERFLSVPVLAGNVLFGLVAMANSPRDYTEDDLAALKKIGDLYAIALRHIKMGQRLKRSHDELESQVEKRTVELRRSNETIRALMNATQETVLLKDARGTILAANDAAAKRFGKSSADEIVGLRIYDLLPPAVAAERRLRDEEVIKTGNPLRFGDEWFGRSFDNTIFPLFDANGQVSRLAVYSYDITPLRQAHEEYKAILRTAVDGFWITDTSGRFLDVNDAYCEISGYRREEFLKMRISDVEALETPEETINRIAELMKKKYIRFETAHRRKDGCVVDIEVCATFKEFSDGRIYVFLKDITQRKQAERLLRQAKEEAESANRAKSEFLANMSHEIRTPMNAITGMAHLALQTGLTEKQRDYVEKILVSARSLLSIINDVLDVSKVEAGKMALEVIPFDLDEVFNSAFGLVGDKAHEKGLEVVISRDSRIPRKLLGDPMRLGQIVVNLLSNAIKFTERGEVALSASLTGAQDVKNGVMLRFSVKDTGIGISEEQQARLFQPFTQADGSLSRKYGGTGLGLVICKRLVELMGGSINVQSKPNEGSVFTFTARFGVDMDVEHCCPLPPEDIRGMRVLVVDDNASSREALRSALESLSFRVTAMENGKAAIGELKKAQAEGAEQYRLMLVDWKMPEMDGIETVGMIRCDPEIVHPPMVIMATAFGREEIARKAMDVGINAFLTKPVTTSTLFDTIMDIFGKAPDKQTATVAPSGGRRIMPKGRYILLVEDNAVNRQVAEEFLKGMGFLVDKAGNGKEAVDKATGNPNLYSMILMDIQMPEMDGYEATRRIRCCEDLKTIPIIAMTAHVMAEHHARAREAGMNDHISKPIDPEQMADVIFHWLRRERKRAERPPESPHLSGRVGTAHLPEPPRLLPALTILGIDAPAALRILGGNEEALIRVLRSFRRDFGEIAGKINTAFQSGQSDRVRELAHEVKGVSGNIAATELHRLARDFEDALKQDDVAAKKNILEKMGAEVKNICKGIDDAFGKEGEAVSTGAKGAGIDTAALKPLLIQLGKLLAEKNIGATKLAPTVEAYFQGGTLELEAKEMASRTQRLDFKGAGERLSKITAALGFEGEP